MNVQTNNDVPEVTLRDNNETPIPNQGRKSLAKVYGRPILYKLKLSNSCRQKHKKRYTNMNFELDSSYSSKKTIEMFNILKKRNIKIFRFFFRRGNLTSEICEWY